MSRHLQASDPNIHSEPQSAHQSIFSCFLFSGCVSALRDNHQDTFLASHNTTSYRHLWHPTSSARSEVMAGGLLGLLIVCAMNKWNPLTSAGHLVAFGLCEIELRLSIPALPLIWYLHQRPISNRRATLIPLAVLAWFTVLAFPSLARAWPQTARHQQKFSDI